MLFAVIARVERCSPEGGSRVHSSAWGVGGAGVCAGCARGVRARLLSNVFFGVILARNPGGVFVRAGGGNSGVILAPNLGGFWGVGGDPELLH